MPELKLHFLNFVKFLIIYKLSLLNLIDSQFTIGSKLLATHFALKLPLNPNAASQPQWVALPEGSNRGGVLGMLKASIWHITDYKTS